MADTNVSIPNFPIFEFEADSTSAGQRWKKYISRFENFIVAMNIQDDKRKRALLLHYVGEAVNDVHDALILTGTTYQESVDALTAHFSPISNTEYETYVFRNLKQHENETLDQFTIRLRRAASTCNFTDTDKEIKSQIIIGCWSSKLRKHALQTPSLSLQHLLDQGRAAEVSSLHAKQIESRDKAEVNFARADTGTRPKQHGAPTKHEGKQPQQNSCRNCGLAWHKEGRSNCKARGQVCNRCGKTGHFGRVCLSTKNKYVKPTQAFRGNVKDSVQTSIAQLTIDSDSDNSERGFVFTNRTQDGGNAKSGYIPLDINGTIISFLIDSGASVDIINEPDFRKLINKPTLKSSRREVFPYAQDEPLRFSGEFNINLKHKQHECNTTMFVSKSKSPSLLSKKTSLNLGLLKFVYMTEPLPTSNYEQEIAEKFPNIFKGVGKHKFTQIKLNIDSSIIPVANKFRRVPFHVRELVEQELQRLENIDIIERIPDSEPTTWISPIVTVPKSGDTSELRLCIDMREPNTAIKRTRHITPTIDDIQYKLNGASHFSKLDLCNGYHQYELHPESRHVTTFATHIGLFRYKRLNFGVNAAAEVFQREISKVIRDIPGSLNISDDILVFGSDKQQHDTALHKVVEKLAEVGLTLNKKKCVFNKPNLKFFGHIFSEKGMAGDTDKMKEMDQLKPPQNQGEVRSLLGMLNFCTRYIPDFAMLTKPLRNLLKKDAKWEWTEQHHDAFEEIMKRLADKVKLAYFDISRETAIWTDASPVGLGAILTQTDKNGKQHIIAFASRAMTPTEGRYSQLEREALAIAWSIEHFNLYVYGSEFSIITDHKPLVPIFNNPRANLSARLERWRLRLQPYTFRVHYKAGKENPADYLSRHPRISKKPSQVEQDGREYTNFLAIHDTPKHLPLEVIKKHTISDKTLQSVINRMQSGKWKISAEPGVNPKSIKSFSKIQDELSTNSDGSILFRGHRMILPLELQEKAIDIAHTGHQGIVKTKSLLRQKVWFPDIDDKVEEKVKGCLLCTTATDTKQHLALQPSMLPSKPWSYLHIDHKGPLPTGEHLLVIVDIYTRFPIVEIVKSTSAAENIPKLDNIFSIFGTPDTICTDNGPPYNSIEFKKFVTNLGIHHRKTTPAWPQANGAVERMNKTLGKILKIAFLAQPHWKKHLNELLKSYRATPHSSTKLSPAELMFNRPLNIGFPDAQELPLSSSISHQKLETNDSRAKDKYKQHFDNTHKLVNKPEMGDCVVVKRPCCTKTQTYYDPEPYIVTDVSGSAITATRTGHSITRNATHFKNVNNQGESSKIKEELLEQANSDPQPQENGQEEPAVKDGGNSGTLKGGHNLRTQTKQPKRLIEEIQGKAVA